DFANEKFGNNYAVIYKREGKDPTELKIDKPQITPIATNRDEVSAFVSEIQNSKVTPIEPLFLDFDKEMKILKAKSNTPVLYKQNVTNGIFSLIYVFDMGTNHDKALGTAFNYLTYLGTSKKSPAQIKTEFYNLACSFNVFPGTERVYVMLEGLAENMDKALGLFEELLADPQVNKEAFTNLSTDILKRRTDAKLNQGSNFNKLTQYAIWGPDSPDNNILSEAELKSMDPQELTTRIKNLNGFEHRIMYYGPYNEQKLLSTLNALHNVPAKLKPVPETDRFKQVETKENKVLLAEYDAKQIYLGMNSNDGRLFDPKIEATRELYNEYFGGSMNAIVFQEMREARGLAYSANAYLSSPSKLKYPYTMRTFIATQNDKMDDALQAFQLILKDMPLSENAFKLAKEGLITRLRTDRIIKENVLWSYIYAQDLGLKVDRRKEIFEKVPSMTLSDIKAFQEEWVKNRTYTYYILGKEADLDMKALEKYGPVQKISQEELFGY
ncbi:MAG TPA: insulinase family protein, partial [Petrimonas sp.]|uniref:M16 family metallopeptidase n=1 Tax=Petrimonas sp. TaxID=2023866 RepID=UPI001761E096|nr:insulinase family protein [Petrimonas sp.]